MALPRRNRLRSLPLSFGACKLDGDLELDQNLLEPLPATFSALKRLPGELCLARNRLSVLPCDIGRLEVGGHVNLASNALVRLPESFGGMALGGNLDLSQNKLVTLPSSFRHLELKHQLDLRGNPLSNSNAGWRIEVDWLPRGIKEKAGHENHGLFVPKNFEAHEYV